MRMAFKDALFDAQLLRAIGHASSGGAEVGECLAAASQIREPDPASWREAWSALAQRVFEAARQSEANGCAESARGGYLRASNYFRAAFTFLIGAPVDPRVLDDYGRHREAFAAALALTTPRAERLAIPYEGTNLHGYFFAGGDKPHRRPTLIVNGGYDSTAEEAYLFSGLAAVARGYNCVTFDGPGQGAAILRGKLVFRPDWEAVIGAVIDAVTTRSDVDAARLALMGVSFGGCLAPRAAAHEPRLAALIVDPGQLSLFAEMKSRLPGFAARELPDGHPLVLTMLSRILEGRLKHPTRGWALRRGMWVHGVRSPLAYLRLTADYGVGDAAGRIACPTLVCAAQADDIGVTAGRLYDALTCDKTFIRFSSEQGAGAHCEAGARSVFNARAFDWMDEVFGRTRRPAR